MKISNKLTALIAAGFTCGLVAFAGPNGGGKPDGTPGTPPPSAGKPDDAGKPDGAGGAGGGRFEIPGVGGIPKGVTLPDALKKELDQFNALRQAQNDKQKELVKSLGGATAEEKAKIKEQLAANRAQFLEDTKQLRADIREQIKALRASLKDTPPVDGGDHGGKGPGRKGG